MWQQYRLSIKGQWLHSGTPQLPSHRFSRNCEKSAQELDWKRHPVAPWQCLCPCHPFDNGFSEGGTPVQLLSHPPYSPNLAPGWLLSVPCGEGPTAWEAVFTTWRCGCSIPRGALCTGWQWLAPVLFQSWFRRMSRRIDAQGEYFEKMYLTDAYLKTFWVTLV